MEIADIVCQKLQQAESDADLDLLIAQVSQQIKNYCHLEELPAALNFTAAAMVLDLQRAETGKNIMVTEIKMGDTSYGLQRDERINSLIKDYRSTLQQFRKLR